MPPPVTAAAAPVSPPSLAPPFWQDLTLAGAAGMAFGNSAPGSGLVAWHEAFWELVDPGAQLEVLAEKDYRFAHEAPVWLPDINQVQQSALGTRQRRAACCDLAAWGGQGAPRPAHSRAALPPLPP